MIKSSSVTRTVFGTTISAVGLALFSTAASAMGVTYVSGPGLGIDITDNDPAGISNTISVGDQGTINRLAVVVSLDHTWVGDLIWTLTGPDGTAITLADRPGAPASGDFGDSSDLSSDYGIIFGDQSPFAAEDMGAQGCVDSDSIVGADCFRWFAPNDPMSTFAGMSILGDWTLTLSDNAAADTGTLNGWFLSADVDGFAPEAVPVPAAVWLFGSALMGLGAWRRKSA